MSSPTSHTLPTTIIHITQIEIEKLLIRTAQEKSKDFKFVSMESDHYGGYKLTFVQVKE